MNEEIGQANSGKAWSRRKLAILIAGILFIFTLVVILGYVFVKMSFEDDMMDFSSISVLNATSTTVSADMSYSTGSFTDSIQMNSSVPSTTATWPTEIGKSSVKYIKCIRSKTSKLILRYRRRAEEHDTSTRNHNEHIYSYFNHD